MGAFLCFMAVRLMEMRRVLKETGSIYLHCDPTASHYLKAVMDAIFGKANFMNEIVWCYTDPAGRRNTDYYKRTHDTILWYAKSQKSMTIGEMFMAQLSESTIKRYGPYFDSLGRITYAALKGSNPGVFEALKGVPDDLNEVWLDRNKGTVAGDWWADITPIRRKGKTQTASEPYRWPTQKPLKLYERIIRTASSEGDMVLDPFCGCATTCVVSDRLNRHWVGIDIWKTTHEVVRDRLQEEVGFFGGVTFTDKLPDRTDDGEEAAPAFRVKQRVKEPEGPRWTRAQMYEHLLDQHGPRCQGCERTFDDPRYLELDHNVPRSDGGINHVMNPHPAMRPMQQAQEQHLHAVRASAGKREARLHGDRERSMTDDKTKRPRGRPVKHEMPERIPDTGANILKAVLRSPPRDEDDWDYLKKGKGAENCGS